MGWCGTGAWTGGAGGDVRVQVCYEELLSVLSLWDRENTRTILLGTVIFTVQDHIICKKWNLCGLCLEDCQCKKLNIPISPDMEADIIGMLKTT